RRLSVDEHGLLRVVVDEAAPDVERLAGVLEVEPPEAEAAFRVGQRREAAGAPRAEVIARDLAGGRVRGPSDALTHRVEAAVRVVDIGLLARELFGVVLHACLPTGRVRGKPHGVPRLPRCLARPQS